MEIHEENVPKLKNSMNSYILQIDGTTDSEFDIIIVVRDALRVTMDRTFHEFQYGE